MKNLIKLLFIVFVCLIHAVNLGLAQEVAEQISPIEKSDKPLSYNPLRPPNSFQSRANPYYWKNKKPYDGYWQQDVYYRIKANINEQTDIIEATEELSYWNNSPDTLTEVYFHLYQNAFQPESYYHNLHINNNKTPRYGEYEQKGLGTVIEKLKVRKAGKSYEVATVLDNTILKITLPFALSPNDSMQFDFTFKTYFDKGSVRRRMKYYKTFDKKHYNGVHWYPRICVYDRKFGWHTDQHLGHEFYGDFGTFEVDLTFANDFVVDATGYLLNREEVLPDSLAKKLDIRNFADKSWEDKPSIIIERDPTKRKTWKFYAENVHDFAFTADPHYRIGIFTWKGIKCVALAQEQHAGHWQNAAKYAAACIALYSRDVGKYGYHKIIVADAADGMEYPMLTLDGGYDPSYRSLLAHEIGHNWFFGMVGTNETHRAFMDEGFTQFLTAWAVERIDGLNYPIPPSTHWYTKKFEEPMTQRDLQVYYGYIADAMKGKDAVLNTHSDDFNGALRHGGGYSHAYFKAATMLYNLEYVLGQELFLKGLQYYFNQWKFCHPYPEDMRQSFAEGTGVDLEWFFDQWLNTTKKIDYAVKKVQKTDNKNEYSISFVRKGEMQMPLDIQVISNNEDTTNYYIPNTWFVKKNGAKALPKWYGWGKLRPNYTAKITVPSGIKNVIIDPSNRLADMDMTNNRWKGNVKSGFDSKIDVLESRTHYRLHWRPDIWYNAIDRVKLGWHFNGNYMDVHDRFSATAWLNTAAFFDKDYKWRNVLSFNGSYNTPIFKPEATTELQLKARYLDGLAGFSTVLQKTTKNKDKWTIGFKSMYLHDKEYLIYENLWQENKWNNTLNLGYQHNYRYKKGRGQIKVGLRSQALFSDYDFSALNLESINHNTLGKFDLRTRLFIQYGAGSNVPSESALYLAGANPEKMVDNKFTRARIIDEDSWQYYSDARTTELHHGGGLNVRGFAGFWNSNNEDVFLGTGGLGLNIELGFDRLIKVKSSKFDMDAYLFADAGTLNFSGADKSLNLSKLYADAGVGFTWTIKKFWVLDNVQPFTLRLDVPMWFSEDIDAENSFSPRFLIGVGRAF